MAEEASKVGVLVHHKTPTSSTDANSHSPYLTDTTINSSVHSSASYDAPWEGPARDFRSPPPPVASRVYVSETTPFFMRGPPKSTFRKVTSFLCSWEVLLFSLLVAFIVLAFISAVANSRPVFFAASAIYAAMQLPPVLLALIITFRHIGSSFDAQETIGPRFSSRLILLSAVILNLLLAVPVYAWSLALGKCTKRGLSFLPFLSDDPFWPLFPSPRFTNYLFSWMYRLCC